MHPKRPCRLLPNFLLVVVLGGAVACAKRTPQPQSQPSSAHPTATVAPTPAAGAATGDSPLAGIDLARLGANERKIFDQVIEREASACGKGHSLLHSLAHDRDCRASFYAVRYIARLAGTGASETEIAEKLSQRFREPRVAYIDISRAPSKGAPSGRVKVVEFADYQCSHCKEAQALMAPLLAKYPNDVVLYFKHFPLTSHNALNAAMAATAAQKQGKFWPYSDKVWQSWDRLTPAVLEAIARDLGLDFDRWFAEVGSDEVRVQVASDKEEARGLAIRRTPAFFINGRRFTDEVELANLADWIDEELGR